MSAAEDMAAVLRGREFAGRVLAERQVQAVVEALANAGFGSVAAAKAEVLHIARLVERDMSEAALKAWRSADARRGLSDHAALLTYADALTRWSERLRMAFEGCDYREDRARADSTGGAYHLRAGRLHLAATCSGEPGCTTTDGTP